MLVEARSGPSNTFLVGGGDVNKFLSPIEFESGDKTDIERWGLG